MPILCGNAHLPHGHARLLLRRMRPVAPCPACTGDGVHHHSPQLHHLSLPHARGPQAPRRRATAVPPAPPHPAPVHAHEARRDGSRYNDDNHACAHAGSRKSVAASATAAAAAGAAHTALHAVSNTRGVEPCDATSAAHTHRHTQTHTDTHTHTHTHARPRARRAARLAAAATATHRARAPASVIMQAGSIRHATHPAAASSSRATASCAFTYGARHA